MASVWPIFLTRIFLSFSYRPKEREGKIYIQLKLYHCAFYQYNHCYLNSYLDEQLAPTIEPIIKGLIWDVGLHKKDLR